MTEATECSVHGTEVLEEEPFPESGNQESPEETTLEISQDNKPILPETSEEMDKNPNLEQECGQGDGPKASPPTEDAPSTELQWEVGAPCQAVWSEDGKVYPATVVAVDEGRCKVRFGHCEAEEDMELNALLSPDASPRTQNSQLQDWKPGSRCRAVYSADGLVYPAVVLWVKDQRCCIRYDEYNNEEEQDVSKLLSPSELYGPSRATAAVAAKDNSWKSGVITNFDRRRRRRDENQGDRGGERWSASRDDHVSSTMKDRPQNQKKGEKEANEKKSEEPTDHSVPLFPSFPSPPQMGLGNPLSGFPPSLSSSVSGGKDAGVSPDFGSMLMLWYLCGFHTGCYVTQQQLKSSSKDDVNSPR